jgi:hypothetical protein
VGQTADSESVLRHSAWPPLPERTPRTEGTAVASTPARRPRSARPGIPKLLPADASVGVKGTEPSIGQIFVGPGAVCYVATQTDEAQGYITRVTAK